MRVFVSTVSEIKVYIYIYILGGDNSVVQL